MKKRISRGGAYRTALRAGAVLYCGGIAGEALLGWKLDPRVTLLSELAARDREHRRIFQVLDLAAGSLFITAGLVHRGGGEKRLGRWLALFGGATIGDALSPLDYPISHQHLRPDELTKKWTPSISHGAHYLTTSLASLAAAGISLEHWRLAVGGVDTDDGQPLRGLRVAAGPTVGLLMLCELLTLLAPKLFPGVIQRLQTLVFSALCLDLTAPSLAHAQSEP